MCAHGTDFSWLGRNLLRSHYNRQARFASECSWPLCVAGCLVKKFPPENLSCVATVLWKENTNCFSDVGMSPQRNEPKTNSKRA